MVQIKTVVQTFCSKTIESFKTRKRQLDELPPKQRTRIFSGICAALLVIIVGSFFLWAYGYKKLANAPLTTPDQSSVLTGLLDTTYPQQRLGLLNQLPYPVVQAKLDVHAESAILIDISNGCILYEKNDDEPIPPASMTKLITMYIVFEEIEAGHLSYDEQIPLPENCWAINQPKDSSLMFLGEGQKITLRELLTGLAVASGNDAAVAIADRISGNPASFVKRMNEEVAKLGLTHTHFVDPSGYSEKNITTAKDFASFARMYITRFPQALTDFHSKRDFSYPLADNLPSWQQQKGDSLAVYQKNTNVLLGKLEGCDGLKTGFIYESGYNLALTAQRSGVRYLSVTMRGPGAGSREGNEYRLSDGTTLMEWAFSSFADYTPAAEKKISYPIAVPGGKKRFTRLVPAWNKTITVPHLTGKTAQEAAAAVTMTAVIPPFIYGGTTAGTVYGQLIFKLGDAELETVPLVSDRTIPRASLWGRFWGMLATRIL